MINILKIKQFSLIKIIILKYFINMLINISSIVKIFTVFFIENSFQVVMNINKNVLCLDFICKNKIIPRYLTKFKLNVLLNIKFLFHFI